MYIEVFGRTVTIWRVLWLLSLLVCMVITSPILAPMIILDWLVKVFGFLYDITRPFGIFVGKITGVGYFRSKHEKIVRDACLKVKAEADKDL